ncbi:universal stress protein [Nocardioides sp. GXQ0305]|uniref:universal stress protein n=1 Tax=Nocardioides sp. GXQ0305 TaxID=3423912 RepID=UPI003D7D7795
MSVVLVGVDGSDASTRAVEFASTRAEQLGLSLCVVHVIPWSPYSFNTPGENERRHQAKEQEIRAATEQLLDPMVELGSSHGVATEGVVRHGDPVDLVIDIAEEKGAVQIVVGRTGDSRMRQAVFGSIPGHLVQAAPVPVTVVP